jgi:hypothetical protein
MDAISELVSRSKDHRELRAFHEFHKTHPEVLDFLVQEIQLRIDHGFTAFSYHSLWQYARWKLEMQNGPGHILDERSRRPVLCKGHHDLASGVQWAL